MSSIGGGEARPDAREGLPRLLVVGAATRDVDRADTRGWRLGGSVTYCSMAAARLGIRVRALVGADQDAASAPELDVLRRAGVDVHIVRLMRGPVFDNRMTSGRRVQTIVQTADPLPATAIPSSWRDSDAVMLVPVAGELADDWAAVPAPGSLVALGWQGVLRRLVPGREVKPLPLRWSPLCERADIAAVSAEDLAAGGPPLEELLTRPGQQLAVTRGPQGALHVERTPDERRPLRFRRVPAIPTRSWSDPTGAGDVFLAAWTAAILSAPPAAEPWRPLAVASAAGCAAVEAASLDDLPSPAGLGRRLTRPGGGLRGSSARST